MEGRLWSGHVDRPEPVQGGQRRAEWGGMGRGSGWLGRIRHVRTVTPADRELRAAPPLISRHCDDCRESVAARHLWPRARHTAA
jgi:hypothetical protein